PLLFIMWDLFRGVGLLKYGTREERVTLHNRDTTTTIFARNDMICFANITRFTFLILLSFIFQMRVLALLKHKNKKNISNDK
ncbi:hypothetical protein ACJX0J_023342, partial [Zea mays]